jgi:formylglycine-generating enzyme required for sulfatase activity
VRSRFWGRWEWRAAAIVAVALAVCVSEPASGAGTHEEHLPGELFRDCPDCAELVVVPSGEFDMGSDLKPTEQPVHHIRIDKNFAIGRRDVTFAEWDRCVVAGGCKFNPPDQGWGR